MKNTKYFLALIFLLVTSLSHAQDEPLTIEKIKDTHTITLGIREGVAPFATFKNGIATGYTVSICNTIVAGLEKRFKQKLDIKYVPVSSANRIALLKTGTIDMECGTTTDTKSREKEVSFTYPFYISGTRFAVRKDSPINDYANIDGARVVIVSGSSCANLIKPVVLATQARGNGLKLMTVNNNDTAVLAVAEGKADAFCTDDVLLSGAIAAHGLDDKLHRVSRPLSVEPYAIMVRKEDTDFLHIVDEIMADYISSGAAMKEAKKWFSTFNHMTLSALSYPIKFPATPD